MIISRLSTAKRLGWVGSGHYLCNAVVKAYYTSSQIKTVNIVYFKIRYLLFYSNLRFSSSQNSNIPSNEEHGEDYLKVHQQNLFWFPKANPSDPREIGPYPLENPPNSSSTDPSKSYQFRQPDREEYFERQQRRKFGEPVPEEAEFQGMWNVDIEGNYSVLYMLSGVGLLLGGLSGIAYFATKWHDPEKSPRMLAAEKELPYTDNYFPDQSKNRPIFSWSPKQ
jgi:hypothetical protein